MKKFLKIINFAKLGVLFLPLIFSGCASFELETFPEKAEIYEAEEKIGETPYRFEQFSGERKFTLKKSGYVEKELTISSLGEKDSNIKLEKVKKTTLNTVPTDVRVIRTRDSVELGRTSLSLPLFKPEVVVLEKEGYKSYPLTLEPNQTYRIDMEPLEGFKSVYFLTTPSGAEISDRSVGDIISKTPSLVSAQEGTEFKFNLKGYQPSFYMINKRSPDRVFVELIPVPQVTIDSLFGAEIFGAAGGEKLGEVPYTELIKEVRAFEIRKSGYYPKTVTLSPESPSDIFVKLEPIPIKRIVTSPEGAIVARIGQNEVLGIAPINILAGSERLIEISLDGYAKRVIGI
ncbi:MAG: hypothetical protein VXZ44_03405, partial [Verrucomicrobiota bacterium]|nr:hypothetical protein [Verrucomicrobiota bacterium]